MSAPTELALVANARMPAPRAQSLQVVQVSAAFARAGVATRLLHARRTHTLSLSDGQDLFDWFDVAPGARPQVEAVPCVDQGQSQCIATCGGAACGTQRQLDYRGSRAGED